MGLILVTPPAVEPVSLIQAKQRLRIGDTSQDDAVGLWIEAARERIERDTRRALIAQTWLERRDAWGGDGRLWAFGTQFRLLRPPLIALEAVTIYAADDTPTAVDLAEFFVEAPGDPGRIVLKPGADWPRPGRAAGGIELRFRCGYGETADDVPAPLREAVLQLVTAMADGGPEAGLPASAQSLIAPFRRLGL